MTPATRRIARIIALGLTFAVAQGADAQTVTPPPVPEGIEVLPPKVAFLVGHATGTQNYVCLPSPTLGRVAWTLFTPQATLFDDEGEQLTTHFSGPNPSEGGVVRAAWEHSGDTSTVWGRVVASSTDAGFVKAGAIPWLKVEVVGAQAGSTGGESISERRSSND